MSNKNPMPSIAEGGVLHSDPKRHRRTNLIDSICAESFASFKTVDIPTIFHDHIEAPTTAIIPGLDSSILKIADNPFPLDRESVGQTIEWVSQKVVLDPHAPVHWMIFNKSIRFCPNPLLATWVCKSSTAASWDMVRIPLFKLWTTPVNLTICWDTKLVNLP